MLGSQPVPVAAAAGPAPAARRLPSTILLVGCGDVGLRVVALLRGRARLLALSSTPDRGPALRAAGVQPVAGNLDDPASLARLAQVAAAADAVLHLAPPAASGRQDRRTAHLLQALSLAWAHRPSHRPAPVLVYASTTGVYGDAAGAWLDETRPVAPRSDRAHRRVDAEARLRRWGRHSGARVCILRVPGIYALDRPGGHPRERLLRGSPVLLPADDVHTNHIHADDLARACVAAMWRGRPQRVVNACDDTELAMGDYFDRAADLCGLPRPPRISRAQAEATLPAMQLSFLSESRRIRNRRLKAELRLRLWHPTIDDGLMAPGLRTAPAPATGG